MNPGARILAEAQAMARINHASVAAVHDVGTYREQLFAAIELVEGTNLRRWMAEPSRTWREIAWGVPAGRAGPRRGPRGQRRPRA
jgi:serine/threonine protein kinase